MLKCVTISSKNLKHKLTDITLLLLGGFFGLTYFKQLLAFKLISFLEVFGKDIKCLKTLSLG